MHHAFGEKQRQRAVQLTCQRLRCRRRVRRLDGIGQFGQARACAGVVRMFAFGLVRRAGPACFQRRVDEIVFMLEMGGAEGGDAAHMRHRRGDVARIGAIEAADPQQGIGHAGA
jgi:hypothetical protein